MKEVKPYEAEGGKKEQVSKMFDNIAGSYDFLNRFLTLGIDQIWRRKMVGLLKAQQPKKVLDVATGTADVAIAVANAIGPDKIIGVDISNEMLEVGRKKIRNKQLNEIIDLREGDSENLPFEDNTFDAVTVAFGVRNFENLEQGLKEILRVMKSDGQLFVLEFSKPTLFPFKQLYNFYFRNVLPAIGKLISKDSKAYTYLYESVQAFPDGQDFENLLNKLGYTKTRYTSLTLGICSIYQGKKS